MDTPNLPENEPEEITWQDDENRATLFLRSVFVLLSGALILMTEHYTSFSSPWLEIIYLLGMNVALPICIIWFFFGQGLRPVEWLTDQKYNAWNYGINFKDWKAHLRWAVVLSFLGIALCLGISLLSPNFYTGFTFMQFFIFTSVIGNRGFPLLFCTELILGISFVWLVWGYLFFGCIQGFSKVPTAILIGVVIFTPIIAAFLSQGILIAINMLLSTTIVPTLLFVLICSLGFIGCWKTKSIAPMVYSTIFLVTITFLVTISVAKLGLPIFPPN